MTANNGTMTFVKFGDGTLQIRRADPEILISAELLALIEEGEMPGTNLEGDEFDELTFVDDYGQMAIYRLGSYDELSDAFHASQTYCAMAPWGEPD